MRTWLLTALLLSAISTGVAAPAPGNPPVLSFLERQDDKHVWKIWRASTRTTSILMRSMTRPQNIYWIPSKNIAYFTLGSRIYRTQWNKPTPSNEQIADFPAGEGAIRSLWLDGTAGRIRVAVMKPVSDEDIIATATGLRYRLSDGQSIPALAIPNWGTPYIASLWELRSNGWKQIARRATKDDAGETPGITVLDELRHDAGVSNTQLLESYTCATGVCRNDVPPTLLQGASRALGQALDPDAISIAPDPAIRPAAIFATTSGDTIHMIPPVVTVDTDGTFLPLAGLPHHQIGIAFCRSLILIGEEGSGNNPIVFEAESGRRIFSSRGTEGTWIESCAENRR